MIVCVCKFVAEGAVRAAREAGAGTLAAVASATGAGTGCGCCREAIARILAQPCEPGPCRGCPNRSATDAVPRRIAAECIKTP